MSRWRNDDSAINEKEESGYIQVYKSELLKSQQNKALF